MSAHSVFDIDWKLTLHHKEQSISLITLFDYCLVQHKCWRFHLLSYKHYFHVTWFVEDPEVFHFVKIKFISHIVNLWWIQKLNEFVKITWAFFALVVTTHKMDNLWFELIWEFVNIHRKLNIFDLFLKFEIFIDNFFHFSSDTTYNVCF